MSADRQRLTSAIRRIAKTDPEIRGLLDAADNKGGKPGAAGVGSSTDAESQRICCDGSTSGSANPGTEERDPDSSAQSGLNSTDPADLTSGDGTLSGVTDCTTGQPICFDGSGFIPPDGWDDPQKPPGDPEDYDSVPDDYAWEAEKELGSGYLDVDGFECNFYLGSCPDSGPIYGSLYQTYDGFSEFNDDGSINKDWGSSSIVTEEFDGYRITVAWDNSYGCLNCFRWTGSDTYDPTLKAPFWRPDSCVNLSIINGTIVGSKYDPENDGSYSAPRDSIDLCDGNGNQISLAPAANGGWKTINSTNDSGYLYDSSGKQMAHIDGNEYSDPSV